MVRLTEDDSTDTFVMWLEDTARIADPTDAANLRACARRMRDLDLDARDNMQPLPTTITTSGPGR